MESPTKENRVLHELALIYIALAYSTDEEISNEELDRISERLQVWQEETSQTVVSALKEAMEDYVQDGTVQRLDRALRTVRDRFPRERRREIVDGLMDVALADGKFLFRESAFIDRVARALETAPSGSDDRIARSWSLLGSASNGTKWTPVHDLALIYVTMAHRSDNDLSDAELNAITLKIREWVPDAPEAEARRVVQDALEAYVQGPDKDVFVEAVASVRERIPQHQLPVLLEDLQFVARADGRILAEEKEIIGQLAKAWDVRG